MRPAHRVLLGLAVVAAPAAGQPPFDAVAKLRQAGAVSCQPSLPFFCGNLHVSCAGRTSLPTFAFTLRATPAHGAIEPGPEAESFRQQYEGARVDWDSEGQYVIVRPALASGYVKLLADGSYSFRHYAQHVGVMSLGRCH
jgi:hypothetical protein